MDRRRFLLTSLTGALAARAVGAQQVGKVWRIGYLGGRDSPVHDEFRAKLRELGYIEGQSILVEYRWYEGRADKAREQAVELVRLGLDVLVATGPPGCEAARDATASRRIPVVMAGVVDPVGSGFVASLARPGGHITGVSWDVDPELMSAKLLQLLRELVPRAIRLAALWNPDNKGNEQYVRALEKTGRTVGLQVQPIEVRRAADFRSAFKGRTEDALVVLADPLTVPNSKEIVDLVVGTRLPAIYTLGLFVVHGGLASYGVNAAEQFGRTAVYVDRILKGARPGDLPVEQPTKFELLINLKTAKALGLTIPTSLLARADQVLE
jgi:putative tryptophan/tyrosine transport system substrate-binding protein